MSKTINTTVQSIIDGKDMVGVVLARLHFDPIYRYTNAFQSVYWDEDGGGDQEYIGTGHLSSMSVLTESNDLSAETVQLTLSGIPNASITDAYSTEYINQPLYVWYGILNKDTYAVEGGQNGPVLIFAGRMDFATIEFGNTASITVNATSRLADWEIPRGGRYTESYQQTYIDPTDLGFNYVQALQNKPISWGAVSLTDPGNSGGSPPGPRPDPALP